jgi:hypothetical protein
MQFSKLDAKKIQILLFAVMYIRIAPGFQAVPLSVPGHSVWDSQNRNSLSWEVDKEIDETYRLRMT